MNQNEIDFIKSVLGNHYSKAIIEHLNKKQIYNSNGNPFTGGALRKIVNGFNKNEDVEMEILKFTARIKKNKIVNAIKLEAFIKEI